MSKKSEQAKGVSSTRPVILLTLRAIEILIIAFLLGILPYLLGKSIWDLFELLIIPTVLAVIAFLFSQAERKTERQIADDGQQEGAFQAYLGQMTELLLEKGLSAPIREVA